MLEIFTNFETKNRYLVQLPGGQTAFYAAEVGHGAGALLTRTFLKNARPFTMNLLDATGQPCLVLRRPWTWFFSELHVTDARGNLIGRIEQRFKFFGRLFDVVDAQGHAVAQIQGPVFRPWTFKVVVGGQEVGQISKKWGGLGREMFTDADTFGVQFSPAMPQDHRALVLAATFLVDFLYFEDRD